MSTDEKETVPSAPLLGNDQMAQGTIVTTGQHLPHSELAFSRILGELPFREPNAHDDKEIYNYVNPGGVSTSCSPCGCLASTLCCLTGIGCCYIWGKSTLIPQGSIGIMIDNGVPGILLPGWHYLTSPLQSLQSVHSLSEDLIREGPVTIMRVGKGDIGFARNGAEVEILQPGLHVRNSTQFKFVETRPSNAELIVFGPIKMFSVKTGCARVCYSSGKVQIYKEGRYAVNSGTFVVANEIVTTQQNLRFDKHLVLLDGGISMVVEGLLTYQVIDVEKLILQLGQTELERCIKDVTKAELSRVFAGLHLEQISQAGFDQKDNSAEGKGDPTDPTVEPESVLGKETVSHEGATRMWICNQVIQSVMPYATAWGVKIINFQLESTKIADDNYAKEYEAASLAMAKAKANLRATNAENQIKLATARAAASALKIEAEGKKTAVIIEAQAQAEARKIEASARNDAAQMMKDPFAKQFALSGQQVEFARALKANSITVAGNSGIAQLIGNQPMLGGAPPQ